MTDSDDVRRDNLTTKEGAAPGRPQDAARGVRGGDPERLDAAPGSGGLPSDGVGTEQSGDLEQTAALGATDDPQGGSIQERGSGS